MIPILELIRLEETQEGTFGILKINKSVFCVTLEPPDRLNLTNKSSIPAQQYVCNQFTSDKYGKTYEVNDVQGRTSILFHAGNTVNHTHGCIILAESFGKLYGNKAVLNSGKTFKHFMLTVGKYKKLHLTIKEVY
jgi:hypothetical protein